MFSLYFSHAVWYDNLQRNGPYVKDNQAKGRNMTPTDALEPINNLQHNYHARAGTTAHEKDAERRIVLMDMLRCDHAGLALRSSNLWCHEPAT